jgi:hypothetical protein
MLVVQTLHHDIRALGHHTSHTQGYDATGDSVRTMMAWVVAPGRDTRLAGSGYPARRVSTHFSGVATAEK